MWVMAGKKKMNASYHQDFKFGEKRHSILSKLLESTRDACSKARPEKKRRSGRFPCECAPWSLNDWQLAGSGSCPKKRNRICKDSES